MRRRWFLLALVAAAIVGRMATRPSQPAWVRAQQTSAALLADPGTGTAEADMQSTYRRLLAVSAAPDLVASTQEDWLESRADIQPNDPLAPPGTAQRTEMLRQQIAAWRRAASLRPDPGTLETDCVYQVDYAPCTVQRSGIVDGSGGSLRFQRVGRYLADTPAALAAALGDGMLGTLLQVYAPNGDGNWHMVLASPVDATAVPALVPTPGGNLLRWAEPGSAPRLFAEQDGQWRPLRQYAWKQDVASRAPAGTCLAGARYAGTWPQSSVAIPELSRMPFDPATLTYTATYLSGETVVARAMVTLTLRDGALAVAAFDLTRVAPLPLLARLYHRCS